MIDTITLEKKIIEYCRSAGRLVTKEELHSFIDSLPELSDYYYIMISIKAQELDDFVSFLIMNGFGSGKAVNDCCVIDSEVDGEEGVKTFNLLFDTRKTLNSEFILKDCLLRRYGISLEEVPLTNNTKCVNLSDPIKRRYDITLSATYSFQDRIDWNDTMSSLRYYSTDLMKSSAVNLFAKEKRIKSFDILKVQYPETSLITDTTYEIRNGTVTFKINTEITVQDTLQYAVESEARNLLANIKVDPRFKLMKVKLLEMIKK